ncbi:hypothetical protein Sango_2406500 [Sesamum angolense]|uniref:Uncharacterized protein n=1 Tax=Sesamum angolense TaxID=2727404 RepID=A0AAE1W777_9LAMI|nr:hypothetical protein Sango_2406500 [Sesamum angolense]
MGDGCRRPSSLSVRSRRPDLGATAVAPSCGGRRPRLRRPHLRGTAQSGGGAAGGGRAGEAGRGGRAGGVGGEVGWTAGWGRLGRGEKRGAQEDRAKVIEWEDYEQELARLCSLTSALEEAKKKKLLLEEKLQSLIQIEAESLNRSNELEQMREKLESRKLVMGKASSILSFAPMDSSRSLAGEKVKVVIKKAPEQELESFSSSIKSGVPWEIVGELWVGPARGLK